MKNGKYTFWGLLTKIKDDKKLCVPIIQRDYAQGRTDERATGIRTKFLNSLAQALKEKKELCLDFVYGAKDGKYVYLIDGQQRMTTLFLLHWYVAWKCGKLSSANAILKTFTYETRTSTTEFLEKLCDCTQSYDTSIADYVRNRTWFFAEWEKDPTVRGALQMLESIQAHEYFGKENAEEIFKKLTETDTIVFEFLPIKSGDSEELYVKMNARGKPLTDYENCKALLGKRFTDVGVDASAYWEHIDGNCSRAFWGLQRARYKKHPGEWAYQVDRPLLQYLWMQVEMICSVLNQDLDEKCIPEYYNGNTPKLQFELLEERTLSLSDKKEEKTATWNGWNGKKIGGKSPEEIIVSSVVNAGHIIELLQNYSNFALFEKKDKWGWIDKLFVLEYKDGIVKHGESGYAERILFFTVVFWVCKGYDTTHLGGYLRVIRNALERYRQKKARIWTNDLRKDFIGEIICFITETLLKNKDCYERLAELTDLKSNTYFGEEYKKAGLLRDNKIDKTTLQALEDLPLFKGTVMPIFNGTEFVFEPKDMDYFKDHVLLTRALLAAGTDTEYFRVPSGESNNNEKVISLGGRDTSEWITAFTYGAKTENGQPYYQMNVNVWVKLKEKLKKGKTLQGIVDEYENKKEYGWRYYFVKYGACLFNGNEKVKFSDGKIMYKMPTIWLNSDEPYNCLVMGNENRFRGSAFANAYLVMAALQLDKFKDKETNYTPEEIGSIKAKYDDKNNTFIVAGKDIVPSDSEDLIEQLKNALKNA